MPKKTQKSFFEPILRILREMGGAAKRFEIIARVVSDRGFTDDEMAEHTEKSGYSIIKNRISWAGFALVATGYLQPRGENYRGLWELSKKGWYVDLSSLNPGEITAQCNEIFRNKSPQSAGDESVGEDDETLPEEDARAQLLAKLRNLHPRQFEMVCKRFMTEIGFSGVEVTNPTNDGGFDGRGYVEVNPFVKIRTIFECKRYNENPVGPEIVRAFLGTLRVEKAEKGVIITTSRFTRGAIDIAAKDSCIELIDGEKLADLFVEYQFGVKAIFEIKEEFFTQFESVINEGARAAKKPARAGKSAAKKRKK